MENPIYKLIEFTGTSIKSIEEAVTNPIYLRLVTLEVGCSL